MTQPQSKYRPAYHFTPPDNWMNDPHGLVYLDGEYHLFYQHNPYGKSWGHMSWGHAVSTDLLHWQHLPIAIWEEPEAGYTIFTGSAVIDTNNTAGFGNGVMVAIYTAHFSEPAQRQDVHIAYSVDKGRTFQQFTHNPVIATGEAKFGDPKVFWFAQESKWIMVNICHLPQGHIELYSSPNLREWAYMSSFIAEEAAPGIWECPDLYPLAVDGNPDAVKWVMKVNHTRFGVRPAVTRYFIGDFDGKTFTNAEYIKQGFTSDDGTIYAEATYNDDPLGRRVMMGWLRDQELEDRLWTGAMAIPRELTLSQINSKLFLCQQPIDILKSLRQETFHISNRIVENGFGIDVDLQNRAFEVELTVQAKFSQRVGLKVVLDSGKDAVFGYDAVLKQIFYILEDKVVTTPLSPVRKSDEVEKVTLRLFIDQAYVELYGDTQAALTSSLPFGESYQVLSVFSDHGPAVIDSLNVWELVSK